MGAIAFRALSMRIGPFLASLFARTPAFSTKLLAALRSGGAKTLTSADGIVEYAKKSPVNMTLLVGTLVSMGASVWDMFDGESVDKETKETLTKLVTAGSRALSTTDATMIDVGDKTVAYKPGLAENRSAIATMRAAVTWGVAHYGSREAAILNLRMLDMLLSVPDADRVTAFENLRTGA